MLKRIRHSLTTLIMLSVLLQSGLFGLVTTAQASSDDLWAQWMVELDFTEQPFHARWTVAVGEFDTTVSPTMRVLAKKTQPIECIPQGSFQVINQEAIFDGSGYLQCNIPSFYHAAIALADEIGVKLNERFMERCECVSPVPWLTGDLTVMKAKSSNPIVHEINGAFDFYTPLTYHEGALQATSNMLLNGQPFDPSFAWTIRPNGNQIWSGTGTESFLVLSDPSWSNFLGPDFYVAARKTPTNDFLHWENANNAQTFPTASKMNMTNLPTTFWIGYDGVEHFVGKIKKLAWDPGCTAH